MWADEWRAAIRAIHEVGQPTVVVVTGGGASAIAELLAVPGASRTVLEAHVPYAQESLWDWLGRRPDHACDEQTALAMASVACQRGRILLHAARNRSQSSSANVAAIPTTPDPTDWNCVGLSCTASLASDRPKKGDHRLFAAIQTPNLTVSVSIVLRKGARTRAEEDALTGQILVRLLAETIGNSPTPNLNLLPDEVLQLHRQVADPRLAAVWRGTAPLVWCLPDGSVANSPSQPIRGLLCGAFDPLHHGHETLRHVAESRLGGPVAYEISITNVDKPSLDFLTIERRRKQFLETPVVLTNAPRFLMKSAILPGMTFVIGSDTAERLLNAKYDGGTQESLIQVLRQIQATGCRFLVAYRMVRGQPLTLSNLYVPVEFQDLFEEIPESEFRVDLSSTELRQNANHS